MYLSSVNLFLYPAHGEQVKCASLQCCHSLICDYTLDTPFLVTPDHHRYYHPRYRNSEHHYYNHHGHHNHHLHHQHHHHRIDFYRNLYYLIIGPDCFRTFEALMVGAIPIIVWTPSLREVVYNLPVLIGRYSNKQLE